jgi:hypothetical protein
MPPKRSNTVTAQPATSTDNTDDLTSPNDHSESSAHPEEHTLTPAEYAERYKEAFQLFIQEFGKAFQAAHGQQYHPPPEPQAPSRTPTPTLSVSNSIKSPTRRPDPKVALPPEFNGKISEFKSFMAACELTFKLCPNTYDDDERKVLLVISRLRGKPLNWALDIANDDEHPLRKDYQAFKSALSNLYSDRNLKARNTDKLAWLVQTGSASAYAAEFQSLIEPLNVNDEGKCLVFYKGLKREVKDGIALVGAASTFTALVDQAIGIDQRCHQRRLEIKKASNSSSDSREKSSRSSDSTRQFKSGKSKPGYSSSDSQNRGIKRSNSPEPFRDPKGTQRSTSDRCRRCENPDHPYYRCPKRQKTDLSTTKKQKNDSLAVMSRYEDTPSSPPIRSTRSVTSSPENSKSQAATRPEA